jgi:NAD(P)-dependent dehydrogenase (short-subunit alcohol dehydrogenase family)
VFDGKLFLSTGSCTSSILDAPLDVRGKVFSMEAGKVTSDDKDLGPGWKHIAAVRTDGQLKLFVNGKLVAESTSFDPAVYNVSTDRPLRIGFGQTDYCLASDMLCKVIGAYRRERPWIKAVGFHWHPWDEVGMAARPETKNVLQTTSDLRLMPLAEGITHLVRELAAGVPDAEVLVTERRHWDRFAAGLGKLVDREPQARPASQAARPAPAAAVPNQVAPTTKVALETHRCVLRTLEAPLPAGSPASPAFESAVWILGNNPVAAALEQRLVGQGVTVQRLPMTDSADQTLAAMDQLWQVQPAKHLFVLTGRDEVTGTLQNADTMRARRDAGILLPFFVTQRWYKFLSGRSDLGGGTFVAAVSLDGNFGFDGRAASPEGGALAGMGKALCIEDSRRERSVVRGKVIDAPANESPAQLVDAMLRELASAEPEVEVSWSAGARRVIRPLPSPEIKNIAAPSCDGGTWVVTGGARGITAIAARELARRHGWTLHLLGKSPPPLTDAPWRNYSEEQMRSFKTSLSRQAVAEGRSPSEAWDRVMKDVEIHRNLQEFADAGVKATYHECDITNREALAATLERVRRADGPIRGVLHGAGLIDPGRFENKRRDFVTSLVNAKFCGTLNLMALTQHDPLAFFVGFGSISGRFGGNGLADYAAGNDAMAKTIDWFRAARPDCASACIHWESWEGSGMATLPRFAWGPKAIMKMKYMTPEEGVERLDQELRAGLPESEVLYTFGDFYPMFYPHEQRPLGPFVPGQLNAPSNADDALPLLKSVRKDGEDLVGDATFDPAVEAFLKQHLLRGKPLLPVVVGLEALAEVAEATTQQQVVGFLNVQMLDGLAFHTERAVTAQARATSAADGTVSAELTCDFRNRAGGLIQKDRPYLRASVDVAPAPMQWKSDLPGKPAASQWTNFSYPDGAMVYHGPAFRGLNGTCFDRQGGWGRIAALPLADMVGAERAGQWRIPSCVLDAALYACGCHLWVHGERAISLPKQIEQLRIGKPPREGETCLVYFKCREITADAAVYDFDVVDEGGAVVLKARGYRKVILARGEATPGEKR